MNILTFDIEEWFHLFENSYTNDVKNWCSYESRIHKNMDRIFEFLEDNNQKATFFCVGWLAKKYPEIIRRIDRCGYEVGSHTLMHELVYKLTKKEFESDVEKSVKILEDITGRKVKYFRAPGFSITESNEWAFDVLCQQGLEIDCSVFPTSHSYGGFPSFGRPVPTIIEKSGYKIKEFPVNYAFIFNRPVIFSGGGYFRLFPYPVIKFFSKRTDYLMCYMHPRDFDPDQPKINDLSLSRSFKSYVGLRQAEKKFRRFLGDFSFVDIATADKMIDWDAVNVVRL